MTATDADDPTYGNSAKLVYTLVQGQQFFSVDPQTGEWWPLPLSAETKQKPEKEQSDVAFELFLRQKFNTDYFFILFFSHLMLWILF